LAYAGGPYPHVAGGGWNRRTRHALTPFWNGQRPLDAPVRAAMPVLGQLGQREDLSRFAMLSMLQQRSTNERSKPKRREKSSTTTRHVYTLQSREQDKGCQFVYLADVQFRLMS
jgi:hypothetical protein